MFGIECRTRVGFPGWSIRFEAESDGAAIDFARLLLPDFANVAWVTGFFIYAKVGTEEERVVGVMELDGRVR